MRNKENIKLINEWISYGKENLLFAKAGINEDFSPFNTICFLCQGSAEKYLKAFLLYNGWILEKTHDLSGLLEICCKYDNSFNNLFPDCEILNEYIVEGRYPGDIHFEYYTKQDAKDAIHSAERIEKQVIKKIEIK